MENLLISGKKRPCAICGINEATTRDHVPPKGIFSRPLPRDLITIPACEGCNRSTSQLDEQFRVHLSLRVGIDDSDASRFWKKEALRTVKHNRRLRESLVQSMQRVVLRTPWGIITGTATLGGWPVDVHDPLIEKIVRGLYFRHFGEVLRDRVLVEVNPLESFNDEISQIWTGLPGAGNAGGERFLYRYGRALEDPLQSIWMLAFYKKYFVSSRTVLRGCESPADS
jgi:hypothetical protein